MGAEFSSFLDCASCTGGDRRNSVDQRLTKQLSEIVEEKSNLPSPAISNTRIDETNQSSSLTGQKEPDEPEHDELNGTPPLLWSPSLPLNQALSSGIINVDEYAHLLAQSSSEKESKADQKFVLIRTPSLPLNHALATGAIDVDQYAKLLVTEIDSKQSNEEAE